MFKWRNVLPATSLILEVAVPSPLYRSFDYRAPKSMRTATPIAGVRVLVPFGRRRVVGILLATRTHSEIAPGKLKHALDVLDDNPVLDESLMQLLGSAARYYQHPIGEVMAASLPVLLRKPGNPPELQEKVWQLTALGRQQSPDCVKRAPRQAIVLKQLLANPQGLSRDVLPVPRSVLTVLEGKGWITCVDAESPDTGR